MSYLKLTDDEKKEDEDKRKVWQDAHKAKLKKIKENFQNKELIEAQDKDKIDGYDDNYRDAYEKHQE